MCTTSMADDKGWLNKGMTCKGGGGGDIGGCPLGQVWAASIEGDAKGEWAINRVMGKLQACEEEDGFI